MKDLCLQLFPYQLLQPEKDVLVELGVLTHSPGEHEQDADALLQLAHVRGNAACQFRTCKRERLSWELLMVLGLSASPLKAKKPKSVKQLVQIKPKETVHFLTEDASAAMTSSLEGLCPTELSQSKHFCLKLSLVRRAVIQRDITKQWGCYNKHGMWSLCLWNYCAG